MLEQTTPGHLHPITFTNGKRSPMKSQQHVTTPNYARYVHDSGVCDGSSVLVIGQVCDEVLIALAKRVGKRGRILVADSRPEALAEIEAKASAAAYQYFQPAYGMHPAFDSRPMAARYQPVNLQTQLMDGDELPFSAETFDIIWIALPNRVASLSQPKFHSELQRVTKSRGRIVQLSFHDDDTRSDIAPSPTLQITYK